MPEVLEMTDAEYFASYADFMTATQLKTFKRSPLIFDLERRGVIDKPETQTLRDGSAFHCAILAAVSYTHLTLPPPPYV